MSEKSYIKKNKLNILVIIPARGGSKGVPRKNIKLLAGKPLISYTIQAALQSKYAMRVVVSTDDDEIAEISKNCGAEVLKRPKELAKDTSATIDSVFHVIKDYETDYLPDVIVLLQPTSPLRSAEDIDNALNLFFQKKSDSLISVCEVEHSHFWCFTLENTRLISLFDDELLKKRRQDLPSVYRPNGAIFISTPKILYQFKSFYSNNIRPYKMTVEKSIDIDTEFDFDLAELIIRKYDVNN